MEITATSFARGNSATEEDVPTRAPVYVKTDGLVTTATVRAVVRSFAAGTGRVWLTDGQRCTKNANAKRDTVVRIATFLPQCLPEAFAMEEVRQWSVK